MSDTIEWSGYNSTLIDRGKLTFWVPKGLDKIWYCNEDSARTYTDRAIEVLSILTHGLREFDSRSLKPRS